MKPSPRIALFSCLFLLFASAQALALGPKRPSFPPDGPADPNNPTPHGQFTLRVMTYNVQGLPFPWWDTAPLREIGRRLRALRANGTAPHVVLLQEGFHQDVVDLIELARYPHRRSGPGPDPGRIGSGILVLSEFSIIEARRHVFDFENSAGFDFLANKGVQLIRVRVPGLAVPISILNTHTQADYGPGDIVAPPSLTIPARRTQWREVRDFFRRFISPGDPVMFGGDMNTKPALPDYRDIGDYTGLTNASDFCAETHSCEGNADPSEVLSQHVDHIFFRSNASGVRIRPTAIFKRFTEPFRGKPLSDHNAVESHFELTW